MTIAERGQQVALGLWAVTASILTALVFWAF